MLAAVAHKPEDKKGTSAARATQPFPVDVLANEEPVMAGMPLYLLRAAISVSGSAQDDPGASGQAKLVVGQPDDAYEREADAVAAAAVGVAVPSFGGTRPVNVSHVGGRIQRACNCGGTCPRCRGEETVPPIQRLPAAHAVTPATAPPPLSTADSGNPLSATVRGRVEPLLGADLSRVRVHSDSSARAAAAQLHAKAFTHQNRIWLGPGQSAEDLGLMAHEATHVVQQGHGAGNLIQRAPEGEGVLGGLGSLVSGAVEVGRRGVGAVREGIGTAVEVASDLAGSARDTIVATIEEYAPGALAFFRNLRGYLAERVSAGFDGLFGGLSERVKRDGIAGAMEYVLVDLAGGALKGIGSLVAGNCKAMGEVASLLLDMGAQLGRDAIRSIREGAAAVGDFFGELWDKYGAPAADALKSFAGSIWEGIKQQVGEVWDALAPVREAASEVWNWLVGTYAEGKATLAAFLDSLFQAAVKKWEEIKKEILPFMGYVKALAAVLLLLSPMGPFIAAAAAAYGLYELLSYAWETWGRPMTADVRAWLADEALPAILSGVQTLRNAVGEAKAWLAGLADEIVAQAVALLNAVGAIPYLEMAQELISELVEQLQEFANNVKNALEEFAAAIGELLDSARRFFAPILEFIRQTLLVALLGPFAILDDGVWATVNEIAQFALSVPCIRELAGLLQLPAILAQGEEFRRVVKSAWAVIQNPDPIIEALHDALEPMVAAVPGVAASIMATAIYPEEEQHRRGVERHLQPAIAQLQSDWWEELKKMGWTLIWPWDEIGDRLPKLIKNGSDAVTAVFDLEISLAIDKFLAAMQDVNVILGALWGWFAIAAVLIGGALGALGVEFSAGATIGAGAAAGWALAETVGLVLLGAMAATELGIVGKSMADIRFTNTTIKDPKERQDANDQDYRGIANSTFTLAVVTALLILGAVAQKIASAIWSKVRPLVPGLDAVTEFLNKPRGAAGAGEPTPGVGPVEGRTGGPPEGEPVEPGGPRMSAEERALLDRTAGKEELSPSEVKAERDIADRSEPEPIDDPPFTTKRELPNGHEIEETPDGEFCKRCSGKCVVYDKDGNPISRSGGRMGAVSAEGPGPEGVVEHAPSSPEVGTQRTGGAPEGSGSPERVTPPPEAEAPVDPFEDIPEVIDESTGTTPEVEQAESAARADDVREQAHPRPSQSTSGPERARAAAEAEARAPLPDEAEPRTVPEERPSDLFDDPDAPTPRSGEPLTRPSLRDETMATIEANAETNDLGQFVDSEGNVIEQPDYGHKYGRENRRIIAAGEELGLTQEQLNDFVNARPDYFQIEEHSVNISHENEMPGLDGYEEIVDDMREFFNM